MHLVCNLLAEGVDGGVPEELVGVVVAGDAQPLLGVNSIDIVNLRHETGPSSVLGHYNFRYVSKLQN